MRGQVAARDSPLAEAVELLDGLFLIGAVLRTGVDQVRNRLAELLRLR